MESELNADLRSAIPQQMPGNVANQRTSAIEPQKKSRRILFWLVLVALISPLMIRWFPKEIARWYFAAALEERLDGDLDGAIQRLDQAAMWDATLTEVYLIRSQYNVDSRDFDSALADITRVVDAYRATDNVRLHQALNSRAYFRALAQRELDAGLTDIQEAIELYLRQSNKEPLAAYLDTRGYLYFLLGNIEMAEEDLVQATASAVAEHASQTDIFQNISDPTSRDELIAASNHHLAVIYHHLGKVHEKQGDSEQAEKYLRLGDDLGYDPENGVW